MDKFFVTPVNKSKYYKQENLQRKKRTQIDVFEPFSDFVSKN